MVAHMRKYLWLIIVAIALILLWIFSPILKLIKSKLSGAAEHLTDAAQKKALEKIKGKYQNHPDFNLITTDVVPAVHTAFGGTFDEDEDTAIKQLNRLKTPTQVAIASDAYHSLYGDSLRAKATEYLTDGLMKVGAYVGLGDYDLNRVNKVVRQNWS